MKQLILLFSCAQMWAQSLQILPAPLSGKTAGSFQIMIVCPPEKRLAALQWRLSLKGGNTAETQIAVGAAAEEAGKILTCVATKDTDVAVDLHTCVLAGGVKSIGDGPIAAVRFVALGGATSVAVKVTDTLGATVDGQPVRIPDVQTTVPARSARAVK